MVETLPRRLRTLIEAALGGNVQLAADNRFNPILLGMLIEINGPKNIAMVSHGHRLHLVFLCFLEKIIETNSSIEEAVLCMNVQVDEIDGLHLTFTPDKLKSQEKWDDKQKTPQAKHETPKKLGVYENALKRKARGAPRHMQLFLCRPLLNQASSLALLW
jgi:hypothetical protein